MSLLALLVALCGARPARAGGPEERAHRERPMEQAIEQMRALRVWRITEELKLDEATAARLFPLLATFDEQVRPLGKERHRLHRELRRLLEEPNPDPARVDELSEQLLTTRARLTALEEERLRATRKVLSPVQQAKLLLILPMVEDELRRHIREAMGKGRGRRSRSEQPESGGPPAPPEARP